MKLIKLTMISNFGEFDEKLVLVNPRQISYAFPIDSKTRIFMSDEDTITVTETLEEIERMVNGNDNFEF